MATLAELKTKSKLPAKQAGGKVVSDFFESNKASIAAVLPKHVSPDRMLKIAMAAMRTTPKLMDCTVESLMGAVVQCSQLGLEPNTALGHAYLIPFENRKAGRTDVQVVIGYKGFLDLARRSGQIISIAAHDVCENDHFEYAYGLNEKLEHRPAMGERGEVIAFYAVAKLAGGGHAFEVVPRHEIDKIRDASQGYKMAKKYNRTDTPWIANYSEMGRKSTIRRLFKYLPVSIEMANATALDGLADAGKDQRIESTLNGEWSVIEDDAGPMEALPSDVPPAPAPEPAQDGELNISAILSGIESAKTEDDIDGWLDAARDADITDAERKKVASAADARRSQLTQKAA